MKGQNLKKLKKPVDKLLEMLTYKRPEGSETQKLFNERFIQPLMGKPDKYGNYLCEVTKEGKTIPLFQPKSNIAFMAHHDTVHRTEGRQSVSVDSNLGIAYLSVEKECLGADCTTGVWLILEMIRARVPAVYVIHTGEECGGIGATAIVKEDPEWLDYVDFAISFDRYGTGSIVTHQSGIRTCSQEFSLNLESLLNLNLKSDSSGIYTDSYEYSEVISECTNISVGYFEHHTKKESQDLQYVEKLREALINADWSKLQFFRDQTVMEFADWSPSKSTYKSWFDFDESVYEMVDEGDYEALNEKYTNVESLIKDFPYEVSEIFFKLGHNKSSLLKEIMKVWNI